VIDEIIEQLLFSNNCVIVPKIGAFIANYKHANLKADENKIVAPSKNIAFNRQLKVSDGLLVSKISQVKNISYAEAENLVQLYTNNIENSLKQNKSYIFKNIGRIYIDAHSNIQFDSFQHNFSIQTYGLMPILLQPITRLKDAVPSILVQENAIPKSKKRKTIFLLIPILFLILSSLLFVINHQEFKNIDFASCVPNVKNWFSTENKIQKSSLKNLIKDTIKQIGLLDTSNKDISNTNSNKIESTTILDSVKLEVEAKIETSTTNEILLSNGLKPNAYICVGAFQNKANANRLIKDIEINGFQSTIVKPKGSTLYRVLVLTNTKQIYEDMEAIKANVNAGAWLYCYNCNY
jgi:hypothetical protein